MGIIHAQIHSYTHCTLNQFLQCTSRIHMQPQSLCKISGKSTLFLNYLIRLCSLRCFERLIARSLGVKIPESIVSHQLFVWQQCWTAPTRYRLPLMDGFYHANARFLSAFIMFTCISYKQNSWFGSLPHLVHDTHILPSLWSGSYGAKLVFLCEANDLVQASVYWFFWSAKQRTQLNLMHGCCWMSAVSDIKTMKVCRPLETKQVFRQTLHLLLALIQVFVFGSKSQLIAIQSKTCEIKLLCH